MSTSILQIFKIMDKINETFFDENQKLIDLIKKYGAEKKERYIDYNLANEHRFCIFDNFSPKYYYEKLHSEILKTLLDPKVKGFENTDFLDLFIETLDLPDDFKFDDCVEIELEHKVHGNEAIDILIRNKDRALIIENKINFAKDQKDQLVRYMRYVDKKLKIENFYVVYWTLIPGIDPPLETYSEEFNEYTNQLKSENILRKLRAVENSKRQKSLVNYFLPKCEKLIDEKIIKNGATGTLLLTKTYIHQYKILLNKLGGFAVMNSTDKELARKIFEDKKLIESSKDFVDFWNNRYKTLYEVIYEDIKQEIPIIRDYDYNWFYQEITDNCLVYFEVDAESGCFRIGICDNTTKQWKKVEIKHFTKILLDYAKSESKYFFVDGNSLDTDNSSWISYRLNDDLTIEEIKTIIKKSFNDLKKKLSTK